MDPAGSAGTSTVWADHGLTLSVSTDEDLRAYVRASGHLTRVSSLVLCDCLRTQLATGRRHAGIDLSGITTADDAGLAVLIDAHRAFQRCRGTLIVSFVSPPVREVITLCHAERELLIDARADLPATELVRPRAGGVSP